MVVVLNKPVLAELPTIPDIIFIAARNLSHISILLLIFFVIELVVKNSKQILFKLR